MSRIEIDKDNPLYDLIDVIVGEYPRSNKKTIAQLVEAYEELQSLVWLKNELVHISEYVKEKFSRNSEK